MENMEPIAAYRIVKIPDPRSRGAVCWYEIERIEPNGARHVVAVCDTRQEARETLRAIETAGPPPRPIA
jgi:hypothetical protein